MKKILTALAVLAVIAAGTAAALFQQLQPEEYVTVEEALEAHQLMNAKIYQKLGVGEDYIIVLHEPQADAYRFMDIRKSGEGYIVKELTSAYKSTSGLSKTFKYSRKESATVTLTPDENGVMQCTLSSVEKQ